MNKIKYFILSLFSILFANNSFALKVAETQTPIVSGNANSSHSIFATIIVFLLIALAVVIVLSIIVIIFVWLISKIVKAFSNYERQDKDFFYSMFLKESEACNMNRDMGLMKRDWKFLFLFWKRKPLLIKTSKEIKQIGLYDGETRKVEGGYYIKYVTKVSFFKFKESIIIIPYPLIDKISKFYSGKEKNIMIECEGIDRIGNNDYYFEPLVLNPKYDGKNKKFIDWYEFVYETYWKPSFERETIKEVLESSKHQVDIASNTNPFLQLKKKNPE